MARRIELPVRAFIEQKMKETFPSLDFRRSTALNDAVANPFAMLIQPFRHELDGLRIAQSLKYYNYLTDQQVDDLLFNLLVFRKPGDTSYGTVRVNFYALADYNYERLTFITASGLRFFNSSPISIAPGDLTADTDGTFYYDVGAQSESTGPEYAIKNGDILAIEETLSEIARVTNPYVFTQSSGKESNFDLFKRAQNAVVTRTMLNEFSIKTVLMNEFPFITDLNVVGAGSSYMLRDIINVDGKNVHTYGKTDIYINTNSVQENFVDITYVPDDLSIDVVNDTSATIVFPESSTSSSGNTRGLFFSDALYDYGSRMYYNNVLRMYQTEFNTTTFTDYIVKTQTPQKELVVVNEPAIVEGTSLIPYNDGWINVDGFSVDAQNEILFLGDAGQGNSYSVISVNAPSFIYSKPVPSVVSTLTGAVGSADSAWISFSANTITSFANDLMNPEIVITTGDAVGHYTTKAALVKTSGVFAVGQEKFSGTTISTGGSMSWISFGNYMDRSVAVGDYLLMNNYAIGGSYDLVTITAVNLALNSVSFAPLMTSLVGVMSCSIHDGLHGALNSSNQCYLFQEDIYDGTTVTFTLPGVVTMSIGSGEDQMLYIRSSGLSGKTKYVGDVFRSGLNKYSIVSVVSPTEIIIQNASSVLSSGNSILRPKNRPTSSPVLSGAPFTLFASGVFGSNNSISLLDTVLFEFVHPNVAVNATTVTSGSSRYYLIDYSNLNVYQSDNAPLSTTLGINSMVFQNYTGSTVSFSNGSQWAITSSSPYWAAKGGSSWGDKFSWFGPTDLDSTGMGWKYPETNPMMQLVIAAGPNQGIYDVSEFTTNKLVKLTTELSDVASITLDSRFFTASYLKGTTFINGEGFPLVSYSAGQTMKITTGVATGYYRITSKDMSGYTITPALTGNVFGNIDKMQIVEDTYQPFFFIANETRYGSSTTEQFEIRSPIEPIRRMAEGNGNLQSTYLDDSATVFSNQFAQIPIAGSTVTMMNGPAVGVEVGLSSYSLNNKHRAYLSSAPSITGNGLYKIERKVQNLFQQEYQILDTHAYYANNKAFVTPVLFIRDVSQIDVVTGEILAQLTPNTDYWFYCKDNAVMQNRYSVKEQNVIRFLDKWKHKGMRVTYLGDPNIALVDGFVSDRNLRATNNDTLVKRMESTIVDVYCQVEGVDVALATDLIEQYITTRSSTDPVQASDFIGLLYLAGAKYINTDTLLMKSYYLPPVSNGQMWEYNPGSRTEIKTPAHSAYIPGVITVESING